jgi:hypothetical protein
MAVIHDPSGLIRVWFPTLNMPLLYFPARLNEAVKLQQRRMRSRQHGTRCCTRSSRRQRLREER